MSQPLSNFRLLRAFDGIDLLHLAALLLLVVVSLIASAFISKIKRRARTIQEKHQRLVALLGSLQPEARLEDQLVRLLEPVSELLAAKYYSFYLFDRQSCRYQLKAVRQKQEPCPSLEVGYSRLTSYQQAEDLPPLEVSLVEKLAQATWEPEHQPPRVLLPVNELGLVMVSPVDRCRNWQLAALNELRCQLAPVLKLLLFEQPLPDSPLENRIVSVTVDRNLPTAPENYCSGLLQVLQRFLQASGALLVQQAELGTCLFTAYGLSAADEAALRADQPAQQALLQLAEETSLLRVSRETAGYARLPARVAFLDDYFLLLKLPGEMPAALLCFGHQPLAPETKQQAILQALAQRLSHLVALTAELRNGSSQYTQTFRSLISSIEQEFAYAVGHAELVARHALAIAKELQLPEQQCRDIALAGLLHDLGMLALPRNLWLKPGRFTDEEYREMSQHAELGAALVEAVAANAAAASYIRHHHEHWDGSGYPQALQGEQIPLGSRVIAVSEVFIAKLSGRQYRSPLPFARALQDLQQAGGKKLDPSVVGALTHWYEKKRLSVATSEQSLAPCWVMRCCPADICSRCPAYRQTERNCWDFSGVNCSLHGNTCATCLIYTEHLGRPQPQMR